MRVKMNRVYFFLMTLVLMVCVSSCQKATETKPANANAALTNSNTSAVPTASQPLAAKTEPTGTVENVSLATPTETYKTGYAARQRKDLVTLKRVLSKDALEFLTEIGKEEKQTLDDQLKTLTERPQAATPETRNEKITGDRASLEYMDEKDKWVSMDFIKEGNEWKIDLPKP